MSMRWLLWKDYRHNRLVVFTALALLLAPHLVALYAICRAKFLGLADVSEWPRSLAMSSMASLIICQLAFALIGGNAIAGERVNRSSEFLFSLPITRRRLLASKLLLALGIAAFIWSIDASILWYGVKTARSSGIRLGENRLFDQMLTDVAVTGLTFFCVAWFLSSFLSSPAYAACAGLVAPLFVAGGISFVDRQFELHIDDTTAELWWRGICLTLAPPCFVVGTWHYLRRVEP